MRQLTAKQKKLLTNHVNSQVNPKDSWERCTSVFKGGKHFLDADNLPSELWDELVKINDTEILHQNVDRFLMDLSMSEIYSK